MEFELNNVKFVKDSGFYLPNALKSHQSRLHTRKSLNHPTVVAFYRVVDFCNEKEWQMAFDAQLSFSQDIVQSFKHESIHFLYIQLCNLVMLAKLADGSSTETILRAEEISADMANDNSSYTKNMEIATRVIMKAFNYSLNDRAPLESSRKWAAYPVLVQLFKAFIHLKTLNLIRNSLRALENAKLMQFPVLEKHSRHISVAFEFFTGFYAFSNEDYSLAYEHLLKAFEQSHKKHDTNKLVILKYLIPCAMLNGRFPSVALVKKYSNLRGTSEKLKSLSKAVFCYFELCDAIKCGNFQKFQANIDENEHFYLEQGVYLVLERLRILCLTRLIRKIYLIKNASTRISLADIYVALKFCGFIFASMEMRENDYDNSIDDELDEVECIIANMIYQGLIRGYISHEKRTLVLANVNPFPLYIELVAKKMIIQ